MDEKKFVKYYCFNTKTNKEFYIYNWQVLTILYIQVKEFLAKRQYNKMIKKYY